MDEEETNEYEGTTISEDFICPVCGIRQYGDICQNCGVKTNEDEKEKKDDDDEYDRRERR